MTKPTNVLLLNDNEADSEPVVRELTAAGMKVTKASATTRDAAKEAITGVRPDVVLSDYSPERFSACDIVDVLRYERPETPLIVVSESVTGLAAVSCLRAGAEDIVIRKNVKRLPSAITTAIEKRGALARLTPRQIEVLRLVAKARFRGRTVWRTRMLVLSSTSTSCTQRTRSRTTRSRCRGPPFSRLATKPRRRFARASSSRWTSFSSGLKSIASS